MTQEWKLDGDVTRFCSARWEIAEGKGGLDGCGCPPLLQFVRLHVALKGVLTTGSMYLTELPRGVILYRNR